MKRRLHFALACALACGSVAAAQPLAIPEPPRAGLEQKPGTQLPLDLPLVDEAGRAVRLGDYFSGGRPVLLVLGYYRCPQLCGLLMHGLLQGLHESRVPRAAWRIVGVSIDPQDSPATARQRRELDLSYAAFLDGGPRHDAPDLHLLSAPAAQSQRLAQRVGFTYQRTPGEDNAQTPGARYAHPATVIVATPQGKVSSYLMGTHFDAADLDTALARAARGEAATVTDRIALLCAHFDPHWGRHSEAVMNGLRAGGLLLAASLALWCWRRRGPAAGGRR